MFRRAAVTIVALIATPASAQLYGVTAAGALIRIDQATGAGTLIASTGFECNAATADSQGRILLAGGANPDQIIAIDPATGVGSILLTTTGRPAGFTVRGIAANAAGALYIILSQSSTTAIDTLATIDPTSGACTVIGPTGRADLQALAFAPDGELYAIGIIGGGNLYRISTTTGAAFLVGGGALGGDDQALEFLSSGAAVACRASLRSVDRATGAASIIGPTGQADIRGLAFIPAPPACYANCDASSAAPILNANDFVCYLNRFVAAEPYANCDALGGLTANDFLCFVNSFVAGCS